MTLPSYATLDGAVVYPHDEEPFETVQITFTDDECAPGDRCDCGEELVCRVVGVDEYGSDVTAWQPLNADACTCGEEQDGYDCQDPAVWVNAAGIRVTGDGVQVWVSTGDPRGAFQMELRRNEAGVIYLHLPHAGEGMPHEDTEELHPGTLRVTRSVPSKAGA